MKRRNFLKFISAFCVSFAFANTVTTNKSILILGANGRIARLVTQRLKDDKTCFLRLFARKIKRLDKFKDANVELIEGDVLDINALKRAMQGVDVVYANLEGDLATFAKNIIIAMQESKVKRLIWISSLGIYNEIPKDIYEKTSPYIPRHKAAAELIENSNLDYTLLRLAWLSNADEISYGITKKGERFINAQEYVSRKSAADLIVRLIKNENFGIKESFGVHRK
ncbi:NAD(P)H-binding protein [uncultured Campylobacter sp.]|uniref:NAD(P)H-binding protein n=1 Tax=uncultured Campylobacter sp. TaxID=218934 RepID=UPI00262DF541|nr:NAD(P)H-binding protein [uncultured Campylobacter sp.]